MKIGLIGIGKLGSILASSLAAKKEFQVFAFDKDQERAKQIPLIKVCDDLEGIAKNSDIILIAVKPAHFESLSVSLKPLIKSNQSLISVMAGVTSDQIQDRMGNYSQILRAMPNVGASSGLSMTAVMQDCRDSNLIKVSKTIFSVIGKVYEIPEKHFDLFTALCASGPAFVFEFVRSLSFAAAKLGFSKELAQELSIELTRSAAQLLQTSRENPESWIERVATPGGCTEAGLHSLETHSFSQIVLDCLKATRDKSRELSLPLQCGSE